MQASDILGEGAQHSRKSSLDVVAMSAPRWAAARTKSGSMPKNSTKSSSAPVNGPLPGNGSTSSPATTRDVFKRLAEGAVDLVVFNTQTPLPPGAVSTVVGEDCYALVMREGQPAARKKWTLADYAKWESVAVSFVGDGMSDIDARLAKAGIARRMGLSTPHFMGCLAAVSATDMIATTSLLFAERHAKAYRLIDRKLPFPEVRFTNTLIGSVSRMNDPVIRWFWELFKDVYKALQYAVLESKSTRGDVVRADRLAATRIQKHSPA
jgi:hypothetical protein